MRKRHRYIRLVHRLIRDLAQHLDKSPKGHCGNAVIGFIFDNAPHPWAKTYGKLQNPYAQPPGNQEMT